ncbi:hypothetical protein MTO96_047060 [Rhipicephalus appendiculatus]
MLQLISPTVIRASFATWKQFSRQFQLRWIHKKCPALTEPDFCSLFNCQQWTLGGADAADDDIRLQMDRGGSSSVGHGTGDMAVALISFLLLTQVCVVIKPLHKDAAAYFTDNNACELRDMETVLRQFLSTSMDPQKCPALTKPDFSSLFNCQQWTLGGADAADDIRLQMDRGGTSSVGHGTGDMAVALISFLLLTQVCVVIKPLHKDAAAYFTDSNACELRDMETVLRQFLSTSMDPQKCPALTKPDFSSLFNCQQWTLGGADAADDIRLQMDRGGTSSVGHGTGDMAVAPYLFLTAYAEKCPALTESDFSSLFNCQQWTLGGAEAADDIRLQMDRGGTSSVGHGTGDKAVALISFLLLTQVCVVIKPLNKDAAAYFTDSNACEVRDMETVLRQFLSTSMDPQKCPALTEPDFSSLFNCQQWTLGGAEAADDIRLQMDRGGTSSVGHGTGDMAVALISFLLLTQVCVVIKPLNKDAAAYFTDSNACELRDMETVLRQFLSTSMDPQKCPALTEPEFSSLFNCQQWTLGGADAADDIRLQMDRGGTSSVGHGTGDMAVALISFLLLTQVCVVIKP